MNDRVLELREKAKNILGKNKMLAFVNEKEIIETLNSIASTEDETNTELKMNTLECIENYIKAKEKMIIATDDYNYLKELAENLRNQKIRLEDSRAFSDPIFKIKESGKEEFVTRKGAEQFIEANSTFFKDTKINDEQNTEDRRKNDIYDMKSNENLEIARVLEIIKRNF